MKCTDACAADGFFSQRLPSWSPEALRAIARPTIQDQAGDAGCCHGRRQIGRGYGVCFLHLRAEMMKISYDPSAKGTQMNTDKQGENLCSSVESVSLEEIVSYE